MVNLFLSKVEFWSLLPPIFPSSPLSFFSINFLFFSFFFFFPSFLYITHQSTPLCTDEKDCKQGGKASHVEASESDGCDLVGAESTAFAGDGVVGGQVPARKGGESRERRGSTTLTRCRVFPRDRCRCACTAVAA